MNLSYPGSLIIGLLVPSPFYKSAVLHVCITYCTRKHIVILARATNPTIRGALTTPSPVTRAVTPLSVAGPPRPDGLIQASGSVLGHARHHLQFHRPLPFTASGTRWQVAPCREPSSHSPRPPPVAEPVVLRRFGLFILGRRAIRRVRSLEPSAP